MTAPAGSTSWRRAGSRPGAVAVPTAPARPSATLMSIRTKIDTIIRTALLSLLLLTVAGLGAVVVVTAVLVDLTDQVAPAERANTAIRQRMTDSETALRAYQLTGDKLYLQPWDSAQQPLSQALGVLEAETGDTAGIRDLVQRQQQLIDQWRSYVAPAVADPSALRDENSQARAKAYFDAFRSDNSQIAAWLSNDRLTLTRSAFVAAGIGALVFVAVAILSATRGLRPARQALRGVAPPLEQLHDVVTRLRSGDPRARADPDAGVVEIRAVAEAINELAVEHQAHAEWSAEELRLTALERDWAVGLQSLTGLPETLAARAPGLADAMGASTIFIRAIDPEANWMSVIHPPLDPTRQAPRSLIRAAFEVGQLCWRLQQPLAFYADDRRDTGLSDAAAQGLTTDRLVPADLQRRLLEYAATLGADSIMFAAFGAGDVALGYIGMTRPAGAEPWNASELNVVQRMARDVGRAVSLSKSYRREQKLVAELQALDTQKNAFVSMVSHELRTPLASISGHLEIVRAGDLGVIEKPVDRSLEVIERNTRRLTSLIGDLLLLSRIEEGARPSTMVPVDLRLVLDESVETLRIAASRAGVLLDVDLPETAPAIIGDPDEVERVFDNLIGNAIKFSPAGARVHIALTVDRNGTGDEPAELVVRVTDQGLGISADDQAALFTRFFRSTNPAALNIPGTGLGLAITKIIVDRHQGRITVDSELGRGTTMTVSLPARIESFAAVR